METWIKPGTYLLAGSWEHSLEEAHAYVRDRQSCIGSQMSHELKGTLVFKERNILDPEHSVLNCKQGPLSVHSSDTHYPAGHLTFITRRLSHVDEVVYSVHHDQKTGEWKGAFEGDMVGEGTVKFTLTLVE